MFEVLAHTARDEMPHPEAGCDEWVFAAWSADGHIGVVSGHRIIGTAAWYWFGLVEQGRPLLTITEWDLRLRSDPFTVKAPEMWAEHHCIAPMEQWTVGNEAHAVALDEPEEALGRAYGVPTPITTDLEWYAIGPPADTLGADGLANGYQQDGVVHGLIELLDRPNIELTEIPARRWRRWTPADQVDLPPLQLDSVVAHTGLRLPFAFPDGSVSDWVLTTQGWRSRITRSGLVPDRLSSPKPDQKGEVGIPCRRGLP